MSALDRAMQLRGQAAQTKEQPHIKGPGKSIGGAGMSALGGAGAGAAIGTAIGLSNPATAGLALGGAALSAAGYFDA